MMFYYFWFYVFRSHQHLFICVIYIVFVEEERDMDESHGKEFKRNSFRFKKNLFCCLVDKTCIGLVEALCPTSRVCQCLMWQSVSYACVFLQCTCNT